MKTIKVTASILFWALFLGALPVVVEDISRGWYPKWLILIEILITLSFSILGFIFLYATYIDEEYFNKLKTSITPKPNRSTLKKHHIPNESPPIVIDQKSEVKVSIENQRRSLDELKRKRILSEAEYLEKTELLNQKISDEGIKKLPEYYELLSLKNSELLSEEQFNIKILELKELYKGFYEEYGYNSLSDFTWNLYQAEKLNDDIDPSHFTTSFLIGKWRAKNGTISFTVDNYKSEKRVEIKFNNGTKRIGTWYLKNNSIHLALQKTFGHDFQTYKITRLGSHILEYSSVNNKNHSLYKLNA
jgi:hypothetical protein